MRVFIFAAVLIVCCSQTACLAASAQPYSALVSGQQVGIAGSTTWEYSLTNTSSSSSYTVWLLAIELDEATEITGVTSPQGWWCDWTIPHFISWMYVTGELPAGATQTGFQAQLSDAPEFQSWTVMFNNIDTGESPSECGIVSAAVPEPTSIMTLFMGIAGLAGLIKRKAA